MVRAYSYVAAGYTIRPYTLVHFAAIPVINKANFIFIDKKLLIIRKINI
jgi:hypothetical protein